MNSFIRKGIRWLAFHGKLNWVSDRTYLKILYYAIMGRRLNLRQPKTFNEKLQWLKLNDHNPDYSEMVDKYAVKKYIANKIGAEYVIPTIGAWDRFEDIDFDKLPNQFVLKCTHDSGGLVVCSDKSKLDILSAQKKIEHSLNSNYYYSGREWPYKNIRPRVIAEQYMADDLRDGRLFGSDRTPRMRMVYSQCSAADGLREDFYDEAWNHLGVRRPANGNRILPGQRPKQYAQMKELSAKLWERMPLSRIDYFEIDEKVYFGEITFRTPGDIESFQPEEWDLNLGEWVRLPGGYRLNAGSCTFVIGFTKDNNQNAKALIDYKFFCFDGVAESVMVCTERETGHPKFYFFDKDWNLKKYNIRGKEAPAGFTLPKPDCIDEMFSIAEKLSKGIPYVRVDLYCIDGFVYFGEMTFYPDSGFDSNLLEESDAYWGKMLILPE